MDGEVLISLTVLQLFQAAVKVLHALSFGLLGYSVVTWISPDLKNHSEAP